VLNGCFGSVAASQYYISERLLLGAHRSLAIGFSRVVILSVCFHRKRSLNSDAMRGWFRPGAATREAFLVPARHHFRCPIIYPAASIAANHNSKRSNSSCRCATSKLSISSDEMPCGKRLIKRNRSFVSEVHSRLRPIAALYPPN
jgi:hypothetical protein